FVAMGAIFIIWMYLNTPEPTQQQKQKTDSTQVKTDTIPKPKVDTVKTQEPKEVVISDARFISTDTTEKLITIETDLAVIELTNKGGGFKKFYLKEYKAWYHELAKDSNDFYAKQVQLINTKDYGILNLSFATNNELINTGGIIFATDKSNSYYKISGEQSFNISYTYKVGEDKSIVKTYKFYANDYAIDFIVELNNLQDIISGYRYDVVWENGIKFNEKNSIDESSFANASVYAGEELTIVDVESSGEKVKQDLNGKIDWVSVRNKYFTVILSPDEKNSESGVHFVGEYLIKKNTIAGELFDISLKIPMKNAQQQVNKFKLYIGPIEYDNLASYGQKFEEMYDWGDFLGLAFIMRPLSEYVFLPLLKFLHSFIPNYGLVIILFSILIKILLYPLTRKSYKAMRKTQALQPKIAEIKEKFGDDKRKVQEETMKLYRTYGINPMGGCLPLLLQMPILVALWSLFKVAIEIRQQPFVFWINDLSTPDIIFTLPNWFPLFHHVSGLALLLGISMFIQQKMTMKDPSQKMLLYMMPILMLMIFMSLPSGLNLYYLMFNVLSIYQQKYMGKKKGEEELVPVPPKDRKKGFMAKLAESAEQQRKMQQKGKKNR
ncbi:MAG: membrane protein insertase YidC, partial [Ignavibacteriales bacterium]|nr:membrane protein insertase YidC [Ignavibacteriales bacterium]